MSIETTGLLESANYKTSQVVIPGHLKNDAAGNFLFGQAGSAWTFLQTISPLTDVASIAFAGLNGNVDLGYRLIWELNIPVGGPVLSDYRVYLRPNGVVGSSNSLINIGSSSAAPTRTFDTTGLNISSFITIPPLPSTTVDFRPFFRSGLVDFCTFRLTPQTSVLTGFPFGRDLIAYEVQAFPQVTFHSSPSPDTYTFRVQSSKTIGNWTPSANVTSLTIAAVTGSGIAAGSVWSLYKIVSA